MTTSTKFMTSLEMARMSMGIVTNVKPEAPTLEFSGQSDNVTADLGQN